MSILVKNDRNNEESGGGKRQGTSLDGCALDGSEEEEGGWGFISCSRYR